MDSLTEKIIAKAIEEIEQANFGMTEEFLKIHDVERIDGKPVVARVDADATDDTSIVYFKVENERFFLAVYMNHLPEPEVRWVNTEAGFAVYFSAVSETMMAEEILAMTELKPTLFWSKGDKRNSAKWTFTKAIFEPYVEADAFEDKLTKLLDYLESDKEGVKLIVAQADGFIQVAAFFHNGNTMLGGVHLNLSLLQRLTALNLEIDFDLYAEGELYKDDN